MTYYAFSADKAVSDYLEYNKKTPGLMYSEENGLFLVTAFSENKADISAHSEEYPDTKITEGEGHKADVVTENLSQNFFKQLIAGGLVLKNNPVLIEQSKALAAEVAKRPLFREVSENAITLKA